MSPPHPFPGFDRPDVVEAPADFRSIFEQTPRIVGRYQLGQRLGAGVLGPSHEAWHLDRHTTCVVKLLTLDGSHWDRLAAERALLQRLQRLGELSHPGVAPLRDAGPCDEGVYVACEYLPGRTLETRLASGWRMPTREALSLVEAVIEALVAAHAQGIVHGNLHAGNVVLDDAGLPSLCDFGLVPAADGRARMDLEPARLGDRAARAPESRSRGVADDAADTYALGVLLYRLLVEESTFEQVARARLALGSPDGRWTPLSALRPDLPPALCAWVSQALSRDPAERPPLSLGVPRLDLAPAAAASPVAAAPTRRQRADRRRWLAAGVMLASGVTLAWRVREPVALPAPPSRVAASVPEVVVTALPASPPPPRLRLDLGR